jgi:Arm domain-containing DNA-binding protein
MISLKLTPDRRRKKNDHTYPLIFRINYKGEARDIKTEYSTKTNDWSNKTNFIKETHPDYKVVACIIFSKLLKAISLKLYPYTKILVITHLYLRNIIMLHI